MSAYAATLQAAAVQAWNWLLGESELREERVWAAAELFRTDPGLVSARD